MNNSTPEIGSQFYFAGDWRTPSGQYEVVAVHDVLERGPYFADCRRIADNNNDDNSLYEGWWAENIQRICNEKGENDE